MKGTLRLYTLLRMNTWPSRWCLGGLTTTPWHLSPTTGSSHAGVGPAHHRTVTTFEEVGRNISPYRRTVTTNKRSVKKKGNAVRSPSGERERGRIPTRSDRTIRQQEETSGSGHPAPPPPPLASPRRDFLRISTVFRLVSSRNARPRA
jgi:hypothetical protein